jgi:biotin transport system permease protein
MRPPALRSPWSYRPGNSPLHRAPAALKLLGLLVISTLGLIFPLWGIIPGAALLILGARIARIRLRELFRGGRTVLIMMLAIVLLRAVKVFPPSLDWTGLREGAALGLTVILSFCAGALLFSVSTTAELREGLEPFLGRRFSLAFALMLGFLPRFFEAWEESRSAWAARAGKPGPAALFTLLPLTLARMIEFAGELAEALESRALR